MVSNGSPFSKALLVWTFAYSSFEVSSVAKELQLDDECVDREQLECIITDCVELVDGQKYDTLGQIGV